MTYRKPFNILLASVVAAFAHGQGVEATIDAGKTSAPISKLVYGQFVEHIGNIINGGLWAEMVDDRKFFNAIPTPTNPNRDGPRFARLRLRPWTAVGPANCVTMDADHPYVGKHSPRVSLDPVELHGLEQAGIGLVAGKSYVGRVVLKGPSSARVSVSLIWGGVFGRPSDRNHWPTLHRF